MRNPHERISTGRRAFVAGTAAAVVAPALVLPRGAHAAAEFRLKYGSELPANHPQNVRAKAATEKILKETNGRVSIETFPNGALGSITDMISQVRSGALEMLSVAAASLTTFDPKASPSIPYAFKDYDAVWAAVDGDLGAYSRKVIATRTGLQVFDTMWDHGFRQMTSRTKAIATPEDLKGFKIRVALVPVYVSLFKALGAAPTTINFSELYTSLQTRVVDGQENSLALIDSAKLYEVQSHCALTNHIWEGYVTTCNAGAWKRLPPDLQEIVTRNFREAALAQREDMKALASTLQTQLSGRGMKFNPSDVAPFRETLKTAGFYREWKEKFGPEFWAVLEKYAGPLA